MTADQDPPLPGLTVTVYQVDSDTGERGPAQTRVLPPSSEPMATSQFPPCACARCVGSGGL